MKYVKGMYLDHKVVSGLTGEKVGTQEYGLAKMKLVNQIKKETGWQSHVRQEGLGIRIMTDQEADDYGIKRARANATSIVRIAKARNSIDQKKLSLDNKAGFAARTLAIKTAGKLARKALRGDK